MTLSKTLICASLIMHYPVEDNIFALIVYKLLVQKKYQNVMLKIALKVMLNKRLRCLKK